MVLKFVRDHAWKFPSMPPLISKGGAEGISENAPKPPPRVSGGSRVLESRLNIRLTAYYHYFYSAGRCWAGGKSEDTVGSFGQIDREENRGCG